MELGMQAHVSINILHLQKGPLTCFSMFPDSFQLCQVLVWLVGCCSDSLNI